MTSVGPKAEFAEFVATIDELESRFISKYLGPPTLATPDPAERLDVAAYVVLAHGALENFIEGVALWTLHEAVDRWIERRQLSRTTAMLLLNQPAPSQDAASTTFDAIRHALSEAKIQVSALVKENHGVTTRHLRTLFAPLGVDVSTDVVLTGSLDLVVQIRHQWAHRYRFGTQVERSAADVKVAVKDCITLAEKLANDVESLLPAVDPVAAKTS